MQNLDPKSIRLTETVKKGGCAAKLPAGQLRRVLGSLNMQKPPELAVGTETLDDACLWDLGDGRYLIQTVDFFTPIVDDAHEFGAIAAANALSDVYAMGGEPKTALSVLAFPSQTLPLELLEPLMRGAIEKIEEAGACLAGGHTIDDDTLKFGFSVSGFVDKARCWTNAGARAGDTLILTKALGTGTLTSAHKSGKSQPTWTQGAIASMKTLNKVLDLVQEAAVHAATDITGFGLAGHAHQMARASGLDFEIDLNALPVLEGARECLEQEILNRAHKTNSEYVQETARYRDGTPTWQRWLSVDPQTSGGLLLCVLASDAPALLARLKTRFPLSAIVGKAAASKSPGTVHFR